MGKRKLCVARVIRAASMDSSDRGRRRVLGGTDFQGPGKIIGATTQHKEGYFAVNNPLELDLEEGDEIVIDDYSMEIRDKTGRVCWSKRL